MIIDMDKRWPRDKRFPTKISIGFLDGTDKQHKTVMRVSKEWEKCNVIFDWVGCQNSQVRITLKAGGCHSETGSDAKKIRDKSKATLFLKGTEEEGEFERHILHEFGHLLGARHEHFSPHFPFRWNRAAVESYWKEQLGNSDKAREKVSGDIDRRLRLNEPHHSISDFDGKSIMMYYIRKAWLLKHPEFNKNPIDFHGNYHLSDVDIEKMREAYQS